MTGKLVVGIDEVGRGCWAGPVVAGAVLLPERFHAKRGKLTLKDSKLLTKLQREAWDMVIRRQALAVGLGWVWPDEIDRIGLTEAVRRAMQAALAQIASDYEEVIIDGNINYCKDNAKARAVVKADNTIPAVSAAAIIAKVARDDWMATQAHALFPDYGFAKHVGYGTAEHQAAIKRHGVCELHRRSWEPIRNHLTATPLAARV